MPILHKCETADHTQPKHLRRCTQRPENPSMETIVRVQVPLCSPFVVNNLFQLKPALWHCRVACACDGGPIALVRDERKVVRVEGGAIQPVVQASPHSLFLPCLFQTLSLPCLPVFTEKLHGLFL